MVCDGGQEVVERQGVEHVRGLEPRAPRLRDAPIKVVELVQVMSVRVDDEAIARLKRGARSAVVEVEPLVRAIELEHGPRLGRLAIEAIPVEIQVVADADLAP